MKFASTALRCGPGGLFVLDQTRLPQEEVWLRSQTADSMIQIIRELKVRGAPLIGVAAALQLVVLAEKDADADDLLAAIENLRQARPTAVNLMNAMDRARSALEQGGVSGMIAECEKLTLEDVELCQKMGSLGAGLIADGDRILTHCNTGGLATAGLGTALGAILTAHGAGKKLHVYVDETRPLLQGARLTTWELARAGVPHTLICDNMAAALMGQGKVDRVMVGADRIAVNGDFANKIGTYGLAVLCKFHGVPFYVVAPATTVDRECANGAVIPIEERARDEVRGVHGVEWAPQEVAVWNPAFDVTPESLVTAWVLDRGVLTREDVRAGCLRD